MFQIYGKDFLQTRPLFENTPNNVKIKFWEIFYKTDLLLCVLVCYNICMEEMNTIRFIDKGFILVYPDREEVWKRGVDRGIGVGSKYIRFRTELYKEQV